MSELSSVKMRSIELDSTIRTNAEIEAFLDGFVVFLLKTKKQIQRLSVASNETPDTTEIEEYLRKMCVHEKTFDSFDITPDYSMSIQFCPKCETIFK
jgi:hypothetical protein